MSTNLGAKGGYGWQKKKRRSWQLGTCFRKAAQHRDPPIQIAEVPPSTDNSAPLRKLAW